MENTSGIVDCNVVANARRRCTAASAALRLSLVHFRTCALGAIDQPQRPMGA
jgi:hypothetical protein